jgi:hypothetical protein
MAALTIFERLERGRPTPTPTGPAPAKEKPAQLLLTFLQKWPKPTISRRDIYIYGPQPLRNREGAINAAEFLVKTGWLVPHKTHRHDWRVWEIVRKPIAHPTIAA